MTNTRTYHDELACRAAIGRDHLLELNSCNAAAADTLVAEIAAADEARTLEKFMYDVFEWYGVKQEELAPRSSPRSASLISRPRDRPKHSSTS